MRVLVTRPSDQSLRTAKLLSALGHRPVTAPVLEIVATGAVLPEGPFDLVVATSAQAFAGCAAPLPLRQVPLACVGEKTAEVAQMQGFYVTLTAQSAERLVERLIDGNTPKSALYLAGRERKPLLEDRLLAANWRLSVVETYEAKPVATWPSAISAALDNDEIDAVLHYSPRSAALALGLIGPAHFSRLAHYCLSSEIADVCRKSAPAESVFTASRLDEEALIALLGPAEPLH